MKNIKGKFWRDKCIEFLADKYFCHLKIESKFSIVDTILWKAWVIYHFHYICLFCWSTIWQTIGQYKVIASFSNVFPVVLISVKANLLFLCLRPYGSPLSYQHSFMFVKSKGNLVCHTEESKTIQQMYVLTCV